MTQLLNWRPVAIIAICLVMEMLAACSNFVSNTREAAIAAVHDPWTWAPLTGAAVLAVTKTDTRVSQWATRNTPLYGSQQEATDASNRFRLYANVSAWSIFIAAPKQSSEHWFVDKGTDASSNLIGVALVRSSTGLLKGATQRERPNGSPVRDSFPSAHASDAFAHAALTRYYLDDRRVSNTLRESLQWTTNGFAMATAWGRVEAGYHYPSDVLIGAALANFATHLFMRLDADTSELDWHFRTRTNADGRVMLEMYKPL